MCARRASARLRGWRIKNLSERQDPAKDRTFRRKYSEFFGRFDLDGCPPPVTERFKKHPTGIRLKPQFRVTRGFKNINFTRNLENSHANV